VPEGHPVTYRLAYPTAGIGMAGRFLETSPEHWDAILGVNLRGVVRGAGDRASGEVASYVQKLKKEPAFSTVFDTISQSALGRDSQGDRLSFELFMKYKGAAAPAKK